MNAARQRNLSEFHFGHARHRFGQPWSALQTADTVPVFTYAFHLFSGSRYHFYPVFASSFPPCTRQAVNTPSVCPVTIYVRPPYLNPLLQRYPLDASRPVQDICLSARFPTFSCPLALCLPLSCLFQAHMRQVAQSSSVGQPA